MPVMPDNLLLAAIPAEERARLEDERASFGFEQLARIDEVDGRSPAGPHGVNPTVANAVRARAPG